MKKLIKKKLIYQWNIKCIQHKKNTHQTWVLNKEVK